MALGVVGAAFAGCSGDEGAVADSRLPNSGGGGSGGAGGGVDGSAGSNTGGTGNVVTVPDAAPPDQDTDQDGIIDTEEGLGDSDGDGTPNVDDPINDGPPPPLKLTAISTTFTAPIGIDYHEPTDSFIISVNYPTGSPDGFARILQDGSQQAFSSLSGLTEEVKIATVRSDNVGGFVTGDLFVGNGVDGQIARITANGQTLINPWVDLPGDNNGLMRGSLYVDRTGEFGGDLMAVTTLGEVWRITSSAAPSKLASVGVHLEGAIVVPNKPARFGPLAGKLIAGAEEQTLLYAFSSDGTHVTYDVGVAVEDIDYISPKENFFGVNYGTSQVLGAPASAFEGMLGDVILTQETVASGQSGLFRLKYDGSKPVGEPISLEPGSATVGQWEHVTFGAGGIKEVPPVPR